MLTYGEVKKIQKEWKFPVTVSFKIERPEDLDFLNPLLDDNNLDYTITEDAKVMKVRNNG